MTTCECSGWARADSFDLSLDNEHHSRCPNFGAERKARLFYYEEAVNAYCPADGMKIENIVSCDNLESGESMEIRFRRFDMTDKEFSELPEG